MPRVQTSVDSTFLGVDPGKQGGLALISPKGIILDFTPMPETIRDISDWIESINKGGPIRAVLEFVSYFPGMGGVSSFTFGGNYYALQMALTAFKIPYTIVRPQVWQKRLSLPKRGKDHKAHKDRLRAIAQREFPNSVLWAKGLGEQRAVCDALLIAEHGRRENVNG